MTPLLGRFMALGRASLRLGVVPLLALGWGPAHALDCRAAARPAERLVCADASLRAQDDALARLYRAAQAKVAQPQQLKAAQRRWIAEVQLACVSAECLRGAYAARFRQIEQSMAGWCGAQRPRLPGDWARAGSRGFFEAFAAGADGGFDSWLHDRPEVAGGSWVMDGCRIGVAGPGGLRVVWTLIELQPRELRVIEHDSAGAPVAVYRRTGR